MNIFETPRREEADPTDPAAQAAHKAKQQRHLRVERKRHVREGPSYTPPYLRPVRPKHRLRGPTPCTECRAAGKLSQVHGHGLCNTHYKRLRRAAGRRN